MALMVLVLSAPRWSSAFTLNEAIQLAKKNLPSYQAVKVRVQSVEALSKASLSPYLPTLNATTTQSRISSRALGVQDDFSFSTYDVTLSYTLFDGGLRRANRNIAKLNLNIEEEELKNSLLELEFAVKSSFFTAIATRDIVSHREVQLQDAARDFQVAEGRHRLGVARLSDVLQSSVRLEQARFNLVEAQGDLKKALSDFNSVVGRPLDTPFDLEGSLGFDMKLPTLERLSEEALNRPDVVQAENLVRISVNNKAVETSTFFPTIAANASYDRTGRSRFAGVGDGEDKSIGIVATWNIFELGKFYRRKSAGLEIVVSENRLDEVKRLVLVNISNTYQDFLTAVQNVRVAEEQLKQAQQNYDQAFGEYRVGTGDILSLVVAEGLLANAREQLTTAELNHVLAKSLLEREAGVERLEAIDPR